MVTVTAGSSSLCSVIDWIFGPFRNIFCYIQVPHACGLFTVYKWFLLQGAVFCLFPSTPQSICCFKQSCSCNWEEFRNAFDVRTAGMFSHSVCSIILRHQPSYMCYFMCSYAIRAARISMINLVTSVFDELKTLWKRVREYVYLFRCSGLPVACSMSCFMVKAI